MASLPYCLIVYFAVLYAHSHLNDHYIQVDKFTGANVQKLEEMIKKLK